MDMPQISDAEWDVMRVLWHAGKPLTSAEIIARLRENKSWKPTTVKTLIGRLLNKQALARKQPERGKEYVYYPLVEEDECIRAESRTFLDRIFGGALKPALVHFLENEPLTPEDIRELKALLAEKEK